MSSEFTSVIRVILARRLPTSRHPDHPLASTRFTGQQNQLTLRLVLPCVLRAESGLAKHGKGVTGDTHAAEVSIKVTTTCLVFGKVSSKGHAIHFHEPQ